MSNGKIDYIVSLRDGFSSVLGKVRSGLGSLAGGVANFGRGAFRALTSLPALLTGGALAGGFAKAFSAFSKQEQASQRLRSSLAQVGDASKESFDQLAKFSSELQKVTKYGDETTQAAMALGLNLGIPRDRIEEVTQAAIGLAEKTGMDLNTAMQLFSRTASGASAALSRYGIVLDANLGPQERLNALVRVGSQYFGQAEDAASNASGRFQQFKNSVGDLWERAGEAMTAVMNLRGGFERLRDIVDGVSLDRMIGLFMRVRQVGTGVASMFTGLRDRIREAMSTEIVQTFISNVATGFKAVIGIIKGLADGTVGIGKVFAEVGTLWASYMKLSSMIWINWLAQALQATVAALTHGLSNSITALVNPSLWAGLAQVIIGSLGAVGAFLIRIFTEPLVLMQAAIDTMIKGMFNQLAGAGGNVDASGTGRLGRRLGIAVQDNNYEDNLAEARRNSWLLNTAAQGANDSKDILDAGMRKVGEAMAPTGAAMAKAFKDNMTGDELFDTSDARASRDAAASALARYGDGIRLPDMPALPTAAEFASATVPAIASAVQNVDMKAGVQQSKADIDTAARFDWMRNVAAGRSPDEQIATNTAQIRDILDRMQKDNQGVV